MHKKCADFISRSDISASGAGHKAACSYHLLGCIETRNSENYQWTDNSLTRFFELSWVPCWQGICY